jgi:hypothetical protein
MNNDFLCSAEFAKLHQEMENSFREQENKLWNSLSEDDKLNAFCYVVRKLVEGELRDKRSYRGVLYDTFEFGLESYVRAQIAGFIDLHNSIKTESN